MEGLEKDKDDIPTKYRGLPSDVVEELWPRKLYIDPEKQRTEDKRRELALRTLQEEERKSQVGDEQQVEVIRSSLGLAPHAGERTGVAIDLESIAQNIPLDEKDPQKADTFLPIAGGNMFADDDEQTLAGKIIGRKLYDELVLRSTVKQKLSAQDTIKAGKDALGDFQAYLDEKKLQNGKNGAILSFQVTRPSGVTGFHLNNEEGRVSRDHLFSLNKSGAEWKNPKEQQVRAYLTFPSSEIATVQRHFVDLCKKLYDEGVDFNAKAASPNGFQKRTDNVVLYIAASDQERAGQLIKEFLKERNIGEGHVLAAIPSPQEGLSWALEPDEQQNQVWQAVSGSSEQCSYNGYVAAMIAPTFIRRLATAHRKKGNTTDARRFEMEAERLDAIVKG